LLGKLPLQDNYLGKLSAAGPRLPIPIAEQTGYADKVMSVYVACDWNATWRDEIILEKVQPSG
jgi:hypothetical protein